MVSDTITSSVNNISELPVNNILQSCDTLYLADTHLNVYTYSRRQLVFLEKRSEGTEFRFLNLCK